MSRVEPRIPHNLCLNETVLTTYSDGLIDVTPTEHFGNVSSPARPLQLEGVGHLDNLRSCYSISHQSPLIARNTVSGAGGTKYRLTVCKISLLARLRNGSVPPMDESWRGTIVEHPITVGASVDAQPGLLEIEERNLEERPRRAGVNILVDGTVPKVIPGVPTNEVGGAGHAHCIFDLVVLSSVHLLPGSKDRLGIRTHDASVSESLSAEVAYLSWPYDSITTVSHEELVTTLQDAMRHLHVGIEEGEGVAIKINS
jgi:hypothetical protein